MILNSLSHSQLVDLLRAGEVPPLPFVPLLLRAPLECIANGDDDGSSEDEEELEEE